MNEKCKQITELEKKIIEKDILSKKIIVIIILVFLLLLHINKLEPLFLDSNGKFSNEIFWNALSAIGSIIAFLGMIYTILYTEKTRKKQNDYEYKKQQMLDQQGKFNDQVMNTVVEIDPIKFIEIIARADVNNFLKIGQELTVYMASLRRVEYQLNWHYKKNEIITKKQSDFSKELNNIISLIEQCILDYSTKISPVYCDYIEKNNLLNIQRLRDLNEDERVRYALINSKYLQDDLNIEITQRMNAVSSKVIDYKNRRWNDFVELGKEIVFEGENIIEETLKGI